MNIHKSKKKVMVFGVFDRLHPGHISFLEQAAQLGTELIAVVTRDAMVKQLKNKLPTQAEGERMHAIQNSLGVHKAVLGDILLGSYEVIRNHQPDVICFGYDQHEFMQDMQARMARGELASIQLVVMKPHESDRFHTSLLTNI